MRKSVVFDNSDLRYELPPLSYIEWLSLRQWTTAEDGPTDFRMTIKSYKEWIDKNGFRELHTFNDDMMRNARLLIVPGEKECLFNPSSDGETWAVLSSEIRGTRRLRVDVDATYQEHEG